MSRTQLYSKSAAFLLAWIPVYFLEFQTYWDLFILMGYPHYILATLYRHRSGKTSSFYWIGSAALVGGLFTLLYGVGGPTPRWLHDLASIYFVFHLLHDERHLLGKAPDFLSGLEMLPTILIFSGLFFRVGDGFHLKESILAANGLMIGILLYRIASGKKPGGDTAYFFLLPAVLSTLWLTGDLKYRPFLGFIILFHYWSFYFEYFFRFSNSPTKRKKYILECLTLNLLIVVPGMFFKPALAALPLIQKVFLAPSAFYIWTLWHLLVSTRSADRRFWIPGLKRKES